MSSHITPNFYFLLMDFGASTLVDMKIYMIFLLLDPSLDFSTMVTKDNDSMICN